MRKTAMHHEASSIAARSLSEYSAVLAHVPRISLGLVVRFTNNVVVFMVFDVKQRTLLKNAAPHALANSVSLVE